MDYCVNHPKIETDSYCKDCGDPICEDCCVSATYENKIEYCICEDCYDAQQTLVAEEYYQEERRKKIKKEEREKINRAARRRYHSPEQVEKRSIKKSIEREARKEAARKSLKAIFNVVGDIFK